MPMGPIRIFSFWGLGSTQKRHPKTGDAGHRGKEAKNPACPETWQIPATPPSISGAGRINGRRECADLLALISAADSGEGRRRKTARGGQSWWPEKGEAGEFREAQI